MQLPCVLRAGLVGVGSGVEVLKRVLDDFTIHPQPLQLLTDHTGGPGTAEGHWRETTFDDELMTGFIEQGEMPLSRMTIASLQDLGYEVNLDAANAYQLPGSSRVTERLLSAPRHTCRVDFPEILTLSEGGDTAVVEVARRGT